MRTTFIYLFFVLALCYSANVFSQDANQTGDAQKRAAFVNAHIDRMMADIELTESQEAQIRALYANYYNLRKTASAISDNKQMFAAKKQHYIEFSAALKNILSAEQNATLQQKAEERTEAGRQQISESSNNSEQL